MTIVFHAVLLIAANGCLFVAGAGVARALGAWHRFGELRRVLGVSYVAGVAAYGVTAQLLYVLGLSLRLWQMLALCAVLAASGIAGRRRPAPVARKPIGRLELAAAGLAGLLLLLLALDSIVQPLSSYDAWSQWIPKGRALVVVNGLDPHVLGSLAYRSWHLDYPLLVPSLEAFAFRFIGFDYRVVHLQQWFFLFGFAAAFVELIRPRVRPLFMWAGLLAILWSPRVGNELLAANADLALGVFIGLAGIAAFVWITESEPVSLRLLALFAAAALATKVEGLPLIGIIFVLTVAYLARRSRRSALLTVAAGAVALIGTVPWRIWVAIHHLPATYSVRAALDGPGLHDLSRGPISTLVLVGDLFSPTGWLLLMPLCLIGVVALAAAGLPRGASLRLGVVTGVLIVAGTATTLAVPGPSFPFPWRASDWLLFVPVVGAALLVGVAIARAGVAAWSLGVVAAMVGMFVVVYVLTPFPFPWHLGTSSDRVVLGPALFLAALTPLLLEQASLATGGTREAG